MTDTFEERKAALAFTIAGKEVDRDMSVTIELDMRLPFVSTSQIGGAGINTVTSSDSGSVIYNKSFVASSVTLDPDAKLRNVLYDIDDDARFTTIAILGSITTKNECMLVHDNKYLDLILIPVLNAFGDSDLTAEACKGTDIVIKGYQVGGTVDTPTESLAQSLSKNLKIAAPAATVPSITAHMFPVLGFKTTGGSVNNLGQTFGNSYIESRDTSVMQFSSIGASANFSPTIAAAIMANVTPLSVCLYPGGKQGYDDLLIPILF